MAKSEFTARVAQVEVELGMSVQNKSGIWCKPTVRMNIMIDGASIVFYLNKSKIENLSKGKIRFMLLRLRLEIKLKDQLPEETYNLIMEEINEIDHMMDTKLDGALEEAIQQEIDLQNY